jgi:hypothetical protein
MRESELRIGNYVKWDDESQGVEKIIGIRGDDTILLQDCLGFASYVITLEEFVPIEITDEWLLSFDFKTKNKSIGWYKKKDFVFTCRLLSNGLEVQFIKGGNHFIIKTFRFVHDFQNFYFSITGKDLIDNLES